MNEQQLKDFGRYAESLVELPDFAGLDRRGRDLRVRRRAGVACAAALAMVLAVAGVLTQTHRAPTKDEPIHLPKLHSDARPYQTQGDRLDKGSYWLEPSLLDSDLVVEFTVSSGWDGSWIGPQQGPDTRRNSWYTNALVLEVDQVSTHGCEPDSEMLKTREEVADALTQAYNYKVVREPEAVQRFGFPATRMRLRTVKNADKTCPDEGDATFHATRDGYIPFAPPGTLLDIWVVEVDGRAIYVQRAHTPNTPDGAVEELNAVIDSIRFGKVE